MIIKQQENVSGMQVIIENITASGDFKFSITQTNHINSISWMTLSIYICH